MKVFGQCIANDQCKHTRWHNINSDANRYIQSIQRALPIQKINFVKSIEKHKDSYPHAHIILHFSTPIRTRSKRYIDSNLFRLLEHTWKHGHAKAEVLKNSNVPQYAIQYIIKYVSKQIYNKDPHETPYTKSGTIQTLWKLRGRRLSCYGTTFNCLTWSRQMQHIYLQEQIKRLVLRKNPTQHLYDYHIDDPTPAQLSERDRALLLKYSKPTKTIKYDKLHH
jgi:hypothetical protein